MPDIKYNMTFDEVLHEIFDTKGWYQGELFGNGVYITLANGDYINIYVFSDQWLGAKDCGAFILSINAYNQKYRRVYTQPEVERKC